MKDLIERVFAMGRNKEVQQFGSPHACVKRILPGS
jgi:hypothetical protein